MLNKHYVLSIDQGTTSSRCILFNQNGQSVGGAQYEFAQHYPKPAWVEHDPEDLWQTTLQAMRATIDSTGIAPRTIAAIGVTNQRETTIVWDKKTGKPICNAIVWQCRRTADACDALKNTATAEMIREKTGLLVDAYFSATKLAWILDNVPGARERAENGELLFGTVDTWLLYRLTDGKVHATDYTNASRTMLFNIHTLEWDAELLALFRIPASMLPTVRPSSGIFGMLSPSIFGAQIPIAGIAGDQHAALFGQTCFSQGDAKNTYGTGCFLLMNTGDHPISTKNGLITTIAWGIGDRITYALEGSVFVGGAAIQWLRDELRLIGTSAETEAIANSISDTGGVYLVPAFTGLGAPYWNPHARGTLTGLTRGTGRAHIVRATLEAIAYQSNDLLQLMQESAGMPLTSLNVDGGASANGFLMQFQADITNTVLRRPANVETTALGAAYLAGLAVGKFESMDAIRNMQTISSTFVPTMDTDTRKELLDGWKKAVDRALL